MSEHKDHKPAYFAVFGLLILGTIVTMAAARTMENTKPLVNIGFALLIASVKASCVMAIFMHLKYDAKVLRIAVFFPLALLLVFIAGNWPDTAVGVDATHRAHPAQRLDHPFNPAMFGKAGASHEPGMAPGGDDDAAPPKKKGGDDDDP